MKKKIAIVGTGIAGMACADRLKDHFDIQIFEKNDYVGGHTHTLAVDEDGVEIAIDTGFMVYNEETYPLLTALFNRLEVKTKPTKMSFSVQHLPSGLEFAGTGWDGLFAQRRNLLSPRHWKLLREINRFNKTCEEIFSKDDLRDLTLQEYCDLHLFSADFREHYLLPMSSAVWSSPQSEILRFPALTLIRFFSNHRFLSLNGQLAWRTVVGGSWKYRDVLIRPFRDAVQLNAKLKSVEDRGTHIRLEERAGKEFTFDAIVLATHADQALRLLSNPSAQQKRLLGPWHYQKNLATLHTDSKVMPASRRAWTSWNYRTDERGSSTIYWMNSLQGVSEKKDYFVSINDTGRVNPNKIIRVLEYEHPLYSKDAVETQQELPLLNETGRVYFCGSYFRYGFHEDALMAGLSAADALVRRLA